MGIVEGVLGGVVRGLLALAWAYARARRALVAVWLAAPLALAALTFARARMPGPRVTMVCAAVALGCLGLGEWLVVRCAFVRVRAAHVLVLAAVGLALAAAALGATAWARIGAPAIAVAALLPLWLAASPLGLAIPHLVTWRRPRPVVPGGGREAEAVARTLLDQLGGSLRPRQLQALAAGDPDRARACAEALRLAVTLEAELPRFNADALDGLGNAAALAGFVVDDDAPLAAFVSLAGTLVPPPDDPPAGPASLPVRAAVALIRQYRATTGGRLRTCLYVPSCSRYTEQALLTHGLVDGGVLAVGRLLRCNPSADGGLDAVPQPPVKGS